MAQGQRLQATSHKQQATSKEKKTLTGQEGGDNIGYVSYRKTRIPRRGLSTSGDPGQGCGIHSGPKDGDTEPQARVLIGTGRAVLDRIFGMPKPGIQWRLSKGCIMEFGLIPSGPGARAPGHASQADRQEAASHQLQAPQKRHNELI